MNWSNIFGTPLLPQLYVPNKQLLCSQQSIYSLKEQIEMSSLELSIIYFYKHKTTEPSDVPITERYQYYSLGIWAVHGGTVKLHFKLT